MIGNSDLKELKWSKTVKIGPADPSVAEIDLAHSENAPDELRLGVKKKSIRAAFHDKFKDDQASGSYKNLMKGNLIEFFPANVRVEAINVCPTNLQVIFDSDSVEPIKDEPGYAYLWVVVKPVSSEDRSANIKQLLKAKPTPVNGKCSIMFHFEQGKRKFSIESHQQFEFKLSAGLPKKLELEDKGISYAGISCENHGLLPEVQTAPFECSFRFQNNILPVFLTQSISLCSLCCGQRTSTIIPCLSRMASGLTLRWQGLDSRFFFCEFAGLFVQADRYMS